MFTLTPLKSAGWMDDELINKVDNKNIYLTTVTMENNCKQHGVRGIIDHSIIEELIGSMDALEYDARVLGKSVHMAGLKYPMFKREKHIVKPFYYQKELNKKYIVVNVLDPYDRKPFCLAWYLTEIVAPFRTWVIAEYPKEPFEKIRFDNSSINDYKRIIKEVEDKIGIEPYILLIDPNYGNSPRRQGENVTTIKDLLSSSDMSVSKDCPWAMMRFHYYDAMDDHTVGHKAVQELLKYKDAEGDKMGFEPRFFIFEGMYNHIYGFTHYRDSVIDPITSREKVGEDGKDFMDCARYYAMAEPWRYSPMQKYQQFEYNSKRR